VAALFVTGLLLFVAVRALLVPPDFGLYGHYRAGALDDIRKTTPSFGGRSACADCHPDISEALAKGKHARIGCESCHGALGRHAADPEKLKPAKLEIPALCLSCHTANIAKPKKFPQIDPSDHGDGARCTSCHAAHHPGDAP
jgi:predicted CXXCH cytochrome family protein